ncbi:MAG: hypothetical protein DMF57_01010 [Acidobacteria bacterium]|nr:MAG: hypothetical protein DMF57_01010 [Acidobacteriota bacterium]
MGTPRRWQAAAYICLEALMAFQIGDAIFDFAQLFFDLFLQFVDLLLGYLQGVLIELALLIREDRHRAGGL